MRAISSRLATVDDDCGELGGGARALTTAVLRTHDHFDQIVSARDGRNARRRQLSRRTERQTARQAISFRSTCWRPARLTLTIVALSDAGGPTAPSRGEGAGFGGGFEISGTRNVASAAGEEFAWRGGPSRGGSGGHTTPSPIPRGERLLHLDVLSMLDDDSVRARRSATRRRVLLEGVDLEGWLDIQL